MSVVPLPPPGGVNRSQGPWDRRSVAELSQSEFRTTMRGFDREEVRAILDSVAADYRVLQLQNASLQRQLADLEAVLDAYQRETSPEKSTTPTVNHALHRASDEAREILTRAHAQAEETMMRVSALAQNSEPPSAQFEQNQRNFRVLLAATVSEMLTMLSMTGGNPYEMTAPMIERPRPLLLEAPAAQAITEFQEAQPISTIEVHETRPAAEDNTLPVHHEVIPNDAIHVETPALSLIPVAQFPRSGRGRSIAASKTLSAPLETADSMDSVLKDIDKAMRAIPALPGEPL
jgi:DivIVA domain-containing protein